jgi:hypothetical protein
VASDLYAFNTTIITFSGKEKTMSSNILTASNEWTKDFALSYMDSALNFSYTSCPDKQEVPVNLWLAGEPNNDKRIENCVSVQFDNKKILVGFSDVACDYMIQVMCQVYVSFYLCIYFKFTNLHTILFLFFFSFKYFC